MCRENLVRSQIPYVDEEETVFCILHVVTLKDPCISTRNSVVKLGFGRLYLYTCVHLIKEHSVLTKNTETEIIQDRCNF